MATYNGQVGITLNMIPGTESMNIYSTFQGQGIEGSMRVDPRTMDLGTIIVGFCQQRKLTIHNSTKGTLNYIIDFKSLDDTNIEDYDLKLDCSQGTIVASSTKDVIISFKPKTASEFRISIFCSLFYSNAPPETYNEMLPQCILCAKAMFPSLSIMRVRGGHFTQTKAWRRLCLDDLQCILAEAEFNQPAGFHGSYDMFGLGGHIEKLLVSPFKFYVGRSHLGSKPTIFELVLKTRNDLPVSWRIRLWNDKESDMENWVDEPEPSNEMENLYMTILEHRLIKVWPHHGHLKPHEEQHIKITYKHVLEGFHEIPAILHIENGHSVPLLLCGETIPCEENILTIEDNIFMLKPIAIENTNPHLQTFELQNDGDSTFTYNVNLEPLRHLRAENYGFEVLRCLNPRGTIPPKESILLNWLFQPIEPKRYITEVLISIDHGKGVTLAIEGYGFKEETRKQENDSKEDDLHLDIPFDTNPFKSLGWLDLPGILSLEHLSFGEVNVVSSIERLVAIKNTSKASRVSFRWDSSYCAESCVHGKFNITPSEGVIECGESCVCQVTFTARLEPQAFETTLHCHVMEMPLVAIQAPQKEEPYEEVFAEHWDIQHKVGTYDKIGAQKALERKKIAEKTQGEQRESALEKLTISVREKLPRLTAKGPLKFPSLSDKMPEEEVEEKPYREGTLFLNVTARIVNNEKRPQLLSQLKCQQNCQGDDCISELSHASSLLMDILYDSAQEILGAQSLESHLLKATMPFFEQCIGLSSNNQALINQNIDVCQDEKNSHIQNTNNECYTHSGSIEKKPTYSIFNPMPKEVERIMLHVNVFDISKIVLEQMMFEVIKDLHDCKINFPPTSKGMKPSL